MWRYMSEFCMELSYAGHRPDVRGLRPCRKCYSCSELQEPLLGLGSSSTYRPGYITQLTIFTRGCGSDYSKFYQDNTKSTLLVPFQPTK